MGTRMMVLMLVAGALAAAEFDVQSPAVKS
jgi:hypothetical protein